MPYAIQTTGLTHRFAGTAPVLADLDLAVPAGSVYGFLGPNGAGKTTTLRLVLGLLARQQGVILVLGQPLGRDRVAVLGRVGSSIETPSVYGHLTARENLRVWQLVFRCPRRRIDEVLHQVGLGATGSKRAGDFSLGMKQRLSIAVALLHQPALLILDEPTNGLDPHGIIEMRDLLTTLNREQGTTIVVSSHLLAEVERLVTHLGVLDRGRLVFQGPLESLAARREAGAATVIDTADNQRAIAVLAAGGWTARLDSGKVILPRLAALELGRINACLVTAGVAVHEITPRAKDLEAVFLDLIGRG